MLSGFKTIVFNTVMAVIMAVRIFSPEAELPDEATVEAAAMSLDQALVAFTAVVNMILRAVTNSPVFKKE